MNNNDYKKEIIEMVENTSDNAVLEYIYKIIADIKKTSAT
nr:MAG TPA: hypothetical protein [Bacteriophage sp.]DAW88775.1 MAG TPA: hypothetical protein [Bacteriophage sp.]DAW99389.1 MAG TPA: hypothetical protein [Bacteriophage sp.]